MASEGRKQNLTKNVGMSVVTQIVILVASFVNRTIFIKTLGAEYLGVEGLFTSILNVFSLAELGIGTAIIYNLYAPIANNDYVKARQYISLYSKAYNIIICIIGGIGVMLIPFLRQIVKADDLTIDVNIYVVYILFLLNAVSSYFLANKQAILTVNQKQRTVSFIQTIVRIPSIVIECFILIFVRNYYLFLCVKVLGNYVTAIIISIEAKKRYPTLCEKEKTKLDSQEVKAVKKNVWALFIRKIGGVVLSSTDNIIINTYISTIMVGIYSNYVMIVAAVKQMITLAFQSMAASIGNFVATNTKDKTEKLFGVYAFAIYFIYGACCVILYTLLNKFILLLWGESYVLSKITVFVIVLDFFIYGFEVSINSFRDTTGNFVKGKYRAIFSALVNVILSLILGKYYGVSGIIFATVLSRVFVSAWYDPYVLYRYFFKKSPKKYYAKAVLYIVSVMLVCLLSDQICLPFSSGIPGFLISAAISAAASLLLLLPYIKTEEFMYLYNYLMGTIKKAVRR